MVAKALGRQFVDTDQLIVERVKMSIPDYMEKYGLERFRQEESSVIRDISKQSGLIIATGGGCVTQEENYRPLHQNGTVIWIDRPIRDLPIEGRPLSIAANLDEMYAFRSPLYSRFADLRIKNNTMPEMAVEAILAALKGD